MNKIENWVDTAQQSEELTPNSEESQRINENNLDRKQRSIVEEIVNY